MEMLDPRGVAPGDVKPAVRRPVSLRGVRIGVLDNSKPNAEDIMVIVAGGPGKHSAIVPTFGATRSVTVRI